MDSECILHNSIVLAIGEPKIIKLGEDLTKFWQKQVWSHFCIMLVIMIRVSNMV